MTRTVNGGDIIIESISINYQDKTIEYKTAQGFIDRESWAGHSKEKAEAYFNKKVRELNK